MTPKIVDCAMPYTQAVEMPPNILFLLQAQNSFTLPLRRDRQINAPSACQGVDGRPRSERS
ncbi:hypothetical protein C8Q73DRAFT_709204 [Cubamyces lactineus]|nr:hypothetical protein C8Q73DRAFT_709204 [Cubamyces lactineus]